MYLFENLKFIGKLVSHISSCLHRQSWNNIYLFSSRDQVRASWWNRFTDFNFKIEKQTIRWKFQLSGQTILHLEEKRWLLFELWRWRQLLVWDTSFSYKLEIFKRIHLLSHNIVSSFNTNTSFFQLLLKRVLLLRC